jgi:predicted porin
MNKKIIAGAIFGMLSGAVYAQSTVTVYGLIDAGLVVERQGLALDPVSGLGKGKTTAKLDGGVINGSRIGFKGTEDLGGGLSALFTIESGFTGDDGQSGQGKTLFGRQSFLGLTGGFGTIKLGRFYSVLDNTLGATDPFGLGLAGRANNLMGAAGNNAVAGYASRFNNLAQYSTANLSGFTADVQYAFGETAGSSSKGRSWGVALNYVSGPLAIRVAQQQSNNLKSTASAAGVLSATGIPEYEHKATHTALGGTYDFGAAKLHAAYVLNKRAVLESTTQYKSDDMLIGVSVPFGASKLMLSFVNKKDKSNVANYAANADQLGVGYTHELSKRTTVYAAYAVIRNKGANAVYTVGNATGNGSGKQALNVGVRHAF